MLDLGEVLGVNLNVEALALIHRDQVKEVVDSVLYVLAVHCHPVGLVLDVGLLDGDELVQSDCVVGGGVHQPCVADLLQADVDPGVDAVVNPPHQVLKVLDSLVAPLQVSIDVHRGPGQNIHPRLDLLLQDINVGLEQWVGYVSDQADDPGVLLDGVRQLAVVVLELLLLEQDDPGIVGDLEPEPLQVLGLLDQQEELLVKVDKEILRLWVLDQEGGLQASLGVLDGALPGVMPERLEFDESPRDPVIGPDDPLALLAGHDPLVLREVLHGLLDPLQELPGPHDASGDGGCVPHQRRRGLLLLVDLLDGVQVCAVVLEDQHVLLVQVGPQTLPLQDGLELSKKVKGGLRGRGLVKGDVDEVLELRLQLMDVHVELQQIPIELVPGVLQQIVGQPLKVLGDLREPPDDALQAVDVLMLRKGGKLLDGREKVYELGDSLAEEVELSEDLPVVEVELLSPGLGHEPVPGDLVLLLVRHVDLENDLEVLDQLGLVLVPDLSLRQDEGLGVGDHLVGDLAEQIGHPLHGVVIPRDRVHHLDVVHQGGQRLDDVVGCSLVQRLQALLQGVKVLDVVLSLVRGVRDLDVDGLPLPA